MESFFSGGCYVSELYEPRPYAVSGIERTHLNLCIHADDLVDSVFTPVNGSVRYWCSKTCGPDGAPKAFMTGERNDRNMSATTANHVDSGE